MIEIGQAVVFVDQKGVDRSAIVTHVWKGVSGHHGCNVVVVSADESKDDQYGRQIERHTSVPHQSAQNAPGYFWR